MEISQRRFVLLVFFLLVITVLGLSVVSFKMKQMTGYHGPSFLETCKAELRQGVNSGKKTIEYFMDKGRDIR